MKAAHVTFDMIGADKAGETSNAFDVMRRLGFSWRMYEGQPIADQIVFYDCEWPGGDLPDYIWEAVEFDQH